MIRLVCGFGIHMHIFMLGPWGKCCSLTSWASWVLLFCRSGDRKSLFKWAQSALWEFSEYYNRMKKWSSIRYDVFQLMIFTCPFPWVTFSIFYLWLNCLNFSSLDLTPSCSGLGWWWQRYSKIICCLSFLITGEFVSIMSEWIQLAFASTLISFLCCLWYIPIISPACCPYIFKPTSGKVKASYRSQIKLEKHRPRSIVFLIRWENRWHSDPMGPLMKISLQF